MEELLSVDEFAKLMKVTQHTVNNWIKNNTLNAVKTADGHYEISKKELNKIKGMKQYLLNEELKYIELLIVDDEIPILDTLKQMVKNNFNDISVRTADSGLEADRHIKAFKPDLILLDIGMRHDNGLNICTNIKSRPSTKNIKIIIISGLLGEDLKDKAYICGADDFLTKPIKNEDLISKINKVLEKTFY